MNPGWLVFNCLHGLQDKRPVIRHENIARVPNQNDRANNK